MNPTDDKPASEPLAALANTVSGRILIVDDELINLDVAARILRRAGFDAATATDGFHALKLLATESFDLVLLDIMMPDMDGFEVCARLRQELKLDTLPVIFVTAAGDEAHLTRAFSVGANDYIIKPYRKVEMIARAKAAVERNVAVRRYAELQRELEKLVGERTQQLRSAMEALEHQNVFNNSLLDTVLSGIITIDAHGRVFSFNKAAEKIFGYSATEVIGANVSMLMPEPDHSHHNEYITNYVTSGRARIIGSGREVMGRRKNGSVFPLELAVSEMSVRGERMFTGSVHDISARKHAELALEDMRDHLQEKVDEQTHDLVEARDEALSAERTMSTFLANMSHEIRTPLHAILSYARFGEKQTAESNSSAAEHFREIHASGSDLLALLNDLLDLSKLKAGKIVYDFQPVALRDLITEVVNKFGPLMKEKGVIAVPKFHGTERKLRMDGRKLAQVLGNLLSNAIKFSPANSIVKLDINYNDDGSVHMTVRDKGIGIPPNELDAIFNPFIQGSHTQSNAGGTGLGLAICKEIIENGHHGKISAANNPEGGACISVILPITTKQTN